VHVSRGLVVVSLALTGAMGLACSSSSSSGNGGTGDGGGSSSSGGSGSSSGAQMCTGSTTLYERLGCHAGILSAIQQIVAAELMDPDLASYFFNQVAKPVPAGHPAPDQIEECLTNQLAAAAGGTETYPTTVMTTSGTFTCRDMMTIHAPFHISGGTFDKFIMIAAGVLQGAKVSSADIMTIGMVLTGQKPAVIDSNLADAGEQPYDAGTGAD
jgi:hypothetical protein